MQLARKLKSAALMLHRKGLSDASALAWTRTSEFMLSHRLVPVDPARRARMLSATLNRWSGVSALAVEVQDLIGTRDTILVPYLRHRFEAAAAAAEDAGLLRPIELAILADCLLSTWAFQRITDSLPAWTAAAANTSVARRVAQTGRRAALRLGRLREAVLGIEGDGSDLGALLLRAEVLDATGRMEEAAAAFAAALHRDGSDPFVRQSYAFHLLKAGHLQDGLSNWSAADTLFGNYPLRRHRPHWTGEPLGSQRLMVLFEHGMGDMIQLARFLPRLVARERDATVLARVPAPLAGLLTGSFPSISFVSEDEREPDYDLFVPSMQLPAVLGATDLAPLGRYIDLGAPTLPKRPGRARIGVCWRGHPRQYDAARSIPLSRFSMLFDAGDTEFVVLLNQLTAAETEQLAAYDNVEVPTIRTFVDLAGLVAACDLVVSVDTAVIHLAGAGGAPALLLSRPDSCWRWGTAGPRGRWYDTVEVLRHGGDLDWDRMLAVAARRIQERCHVPVIAREC